MTDPVVLFASCILFVAFFIRALTGFGAGLISIPLLALFWDVGFVVPMELLFEVGLSVLLLPKVWRDIDFKHVINLAVGMFFGNLIGSFSLANFNAPLLRLLLAGLVLLFSIYLGASARKPPQLNIPHRWGFLFGLGGGFFGGAFGMSGPVVMLYLAHQIPDKTRLRATVIALFFLASTWTVFMHWANGLYNAESFRVLLLLTPAFLIGTALGHLAHFKTSDSAFRYIVAAILFVSSLLLFFK